ncbi:flavin-containing monooxygenase [Antrihabitans spumae]|uniref:Flavin-containing monooxygenase n=1 Tax=Antrihabitans spumae TaxID=3373370 RepID=A0ABW7KH11_9NOCA
MNQAPDTALLDHQVVIVGAGFGGIGAAIELKRAGIHDFVIIDKATDIGGTWHANTYPGVAVDIPSIYYSFSYEPPKTWSRFFAPGQEVKAYAAQLVDNYALRPHLRLNTTLSAMEWNEAASTWTATLSTGETVTSRFVIGAVGGLEQPKLPDIDGVDTFEGKAVHTARWDHDYDYRGKRIAVIGTGATALQLIPEIAQIAGQVDVFQRTPIWVAPKPDFAMAAASRTALRFVPGLRRSVRAGVVLGIDVGLTVANSMHDKLPFVLDAAGAALKLWYKSQVPDPILREKLTPTYALGCKRPSVSNRYLATFNRSNVELITDPITRITATGVVTADGREHPTDVIVYATGFKVMERGSTPPFPLLGRNGVDLNEWWDRNRYQAYQGVSVPGFPNSFLITGPYGFAAGSYIAMIECTSRHAARVIVETLRRGETTAEIKQKPHDDYYALCRKRGDGSLWHSGSCAGSNTYYLNYQGDPAPIRLSTHAEMWWGNKHFPLDNYQYSTTASSTTVPRTLASGKV